MAVIRFLTGLKVFAVLDELLHACEFRSLVTRDEAALMVIDFRSNSEVFPRYLLLAEKLHQNIAEALKVILPIIPK